MNEMDNDKIIILEEQMKEVCNKIDKLDQKVERGFADIKTDMHEYVRKDNYQRDMKAMNKQDRQLSEEIRRVSNAIKSTNSIVNKLIWLLASTMVGFIIMQILEKVH